MKWTDILRAFSCYVCSGLLIRLCLVGLGRAGQGRGAGFPPESDLRKPGSSHIPSKSNKIRLIITLTEFFW